MRACSVEPDSLTATNWPVIEGIPDTGSYLEISLRSWTWPLHSGTSSAALPFFKKNPSFFNQIFFRKMFERTCVCFRDLYSTVFGVYLGIVERSFFHYQSWNDEVPEIPQTLSESLWLGLLFSYTHFSLNLL